MNKIKDLINDRLMISFRQFEKETGVTRQTIIAFCWAKTSRLY